VFTIKERAGKGEPTRGEELVLFKQGQGGRSIAPFLSNKGRLRLPFEIHVQRLNELGLVNLNIAGVREEQNSVITGQAVQQQTELVV
jgi:hypothetical protein